MMVQLFGNLMVVTMLLSVPPRGRLGAGLGGILQGTLEGGTQAGEDDAHMGM